MTVRRERGGTRTAVAHLHAISVLRPLSPVVGRPRDGEVSSFAEPHFIVVPRRPQRPASRLARRMQLPG